MARSPRTHPCLAQPPTEDKSSSRIPPRGCREFSLRLVSRNVEKSFYILSGIDLRPSLSSHLSSLVETSTLIPANFPLTFHFLLFSSFSFFQVVRFIFGRGVHALSEDLVFGKGRMDFRGGQVTNGGGNLENEDRFGQV